MSKARQTKLNHEQKIILNTYRHDGSYKQAEFYQDPDDSMYTAIVTPACEGVSLPASKYVRVAISVQGFTEKKFRPKAGLFNALMHLEDGNYITINHGDLYELLYAFGLANVDPQPFTK